MCGESNHGTNIREDIKLLMTNNDWRAGGDCLE